MSNENVCLYVWSVRCVAVMSRPRVCVSVWERIIGSRASWKCALLGRIFRVPALLAQCVWHVHRVRRDVVILVMLWFLTSRGDVGRRRQCSGRGARCKTSDDVGTCGSGQMSAIGSSSCASSCPANTYLAAPGSKQCIACGVGTYNDGTMTSCAVCESRCVEFAL